MADKAAEEVKQAMLKQHRENPREKARQAAAAKKKAEHEAQLKADADAKAAAAQAELDFKWAQGWAGVEGRDLDHWNRDFRRRAVENFGQLATNIPLAAAPFARRIAAKLDDADAGVRFAAVVALGNMDAEAAADYADDVARRLDDPFPASREAACATLGGMPVRAAMPHIQAIVLRLDDVVPGVRHGAVGSLKRLGALVTPHAARVAARLTDPSRLVRYSAAEVLKNLGDVAPDAVAPFAGDLAQRLADDAKEVKEIAELGLGNLGEAAAPPGRELEAAASWEALRVELLATLDKKRQRAAVESLCLGNIARCNVAKATVDPLADALALAKTAGDRARITRQFMQSDGNGADANGAKAREKRRMLAHAQDCLERALAHAREISDHRGEGKHLGNLGAVYTLLESPERALDCLEDALKASVRARDERDQCRHLVNMGHSQLALGDVDTAIQTLVRALGMSRALGLRRSEGTVLRNLSKCYETLGDGHERRALEYRVEADAVERELRRERRQQLEDHAMAEAHAKERGDGEPTEPAAAADAPRERRDEISSRPGVGPGGT